MAAVDRLQLMSTTFLVVCFCSHLSQYYLTVLLSDSPPDIENAVWRPSSRRLKCGLQEIELLDWELLGKKVRPIIGSRCGFVPQGIGEPVGERAQTLDALSDLTVASERCRCEKKNGTAPSKGIINRYWHSTD